MSQKGLGAEAGSPGSRRMSALTASAIEEAVAKNKEEAPPRSPFTVKYEGDDQEPADIPPADAEDLIASATSMVKPASVEAQLAAAINAAEAGPVESVTFSDGGGASSFIPLGVVIRFATSNRPTHRALVVDMQTLYCNLGALRAVRYDVDRYNQSLDYEAMVFGGGGDGEEEDERTATLLSFRFYQQCRTWGFRQPEHMPAVIPGLDALIALIETAHADAIGLARELIAGGAADFEAVGWRGGGGGRVGGREAGGRRMNAVRRGVDGVRPPLSLRSVPPLTLALRFPNPSCTTSWPSSTSLAPRSSTRPAC